jgi:hypothetical protein
MKSYPDGRGSLGCASHPKVAKAHQRQISEADWERASTEPTGNPTLFEWGHQSPPKKGKWCKMGGSKWPGNPEIVVSQRLRRFPSDPDGTRTRVAGVKGRCPRPLDDGAKWCPASAGAPMNS